MLQHFNEYGYQGVFVALIAAGFGFPIPEELPVITAGVLVGHEDTTLKWYIMLPVVMAGVVIGDGILYAIGRVYGRRLLNLGWVQRHFVPPEKRAEIERNFAARGIMVLLGARLLPGIRTPIFIMAGVLRVPFGRFLFADAIYAIPMVNVLFWLSYMLTDQVLEIFNKINAYRPLVVVAILSGIAGALIQKYVLSRHVSTGEPPHMPKLITKPAGAIGHAIESAVEKVKGRHHPTDKETSDSGQGTGDGKSTTEPGEGARQTASADGKPSPSAEQGRIAER
jgi:membrane protein DedA with SNARE-associated domain